VKVIGLTGGIATGKSTVSKWLQKRGFQVIDADQIVHELQSIGSPMLASIAAEFGKSVICADGSLDRKTLGQIIFNDPNARHKLEAIMHPAVRAECNEQIAQSQANVLFLDVPLLFEAGFDDLADVTVVVSATEQTQLQRLMKRDELSFDQAQERIHSQMPIAEKSRRANFVIDNNGNLCELEENIERFLGEIIN